MKDKKGQNLVEFALVVPLLLLLVIGIAEFGRAWMTKNILTGAAREAVVLRPFLISHWVWNGRGGDNPWQPDSYLCRNHLPTVSVTDSLTGTFGDVTVTVNYNFPVAVAGFIPGLDCTTISALQHDDHAQGILRKRGETIG